MRILLFLLLPLLLYANDRRVRGIDLTSSAKDTIKSITTDSSAVMRTWAQGQIEDSLTVTIAGKSVNIRDYIQDRKQSLVESYGAVSNDGNDDTAYMQAMVDSVIANGGEIVLSSGVYYLADSVRLAPGAGNTLIIRGIPGETWFIGDTSSVSERFDNGFHVVDGSVEFDGLNFRHMYTPIILKPSSSGSIENLTINNCYFDSLRIKAGGFYTNYVDSIVYNIRVTNNIVKNSRGGFVFNGHVKKALFESNIFTNINGKNLSAICMSAGNNTKDTLIDRWYSSSLYYGYIFSNNICDSIYATATTEIEVHGIMAFGRRVLVANNIISNVWSTHDTSGAEGIYLKSIGSNIVGNILWNGGVGEACIAEKGEELSDDCLITGNIVYKDARFTGYGIYTTCDSKVEGNYVYIPDRTAVSASGTGIRVSYEGKKLDILNNYVHVEGIGINCGSGKTSNGGVITIAGNYVRSDSSLSVQQGLGSYDSEETIIDHNRLYSYYTGIVSIPSTAQKVTITNNPVLSMDGCTTSGYGISVTGAERFTFDNNKVYSDSSTSTTEVLYIQNARIGEIKDNEFYDNGNASRWIRLNQGTTNADRWLFSGNSFLVDDEIFEEPSYIINTGTDTITTAIYQNNIFSNISDSTFVQAIYHGAYSATLIFKDNIYDANFTRGIALNGTGKSYGTLYFANNVWLNPAGHFLVDDTGQSTWVDITATNLVRLNNGLDGDMGSYLGQVFINSATDSVYDLYYNPATNSIDTTKVPRALE